jgi:hypothetical protein
MAGPEPFRGSVEQGVGIVIHGKRTRVMRGKSRREGSFLGV